MQELGTKPIQPSSITHRPQQVLATGTVPSGLEPYKPLNMVAGGEVNHPHLPLTRLSTGDVRPAQFWGSLYSPRLQKASGFEQWCEDVLESLRLCNIPANILLKSPPSLRDIELQFPDSTGAEQRAMFEEVLSSYQHHNTRAWDVVAVLNNA